MVVEIETRLNRLLAAINLLMVLQRHLHPVLIDQVKKTVWA